MAYDQPNQKKGSEFRKKCGAFNKYACAPGHFPAKTLKHPLNLGK